MHERPDEVSVRLDLVALMLDESGWEEALEASEEALELSPDNSRARFYRAIALDETGRRDEAKRELEDLGREEAGGYGAEARDVLASRSFE